MNIGNKVPDNQSSELSTRQLLKSFVKSNYLDTTEFFIVDKSIVDDPDIICEQFNQHLSQSYNPATESFINALPMLTSRHISKIDFIPFKMKQAIAVLKNSYDEGLEGIPSSLVKNGSRQFPLFCLKPFNLSMEYEAYPTVWNTSVITRWFETGSLSDIVNYRQMNLTSVLSRSMDKFVYKQFIPFLLWANLISSFQYGFMTKR